MVRQMGIRCAHQAVANCRCYFVPIVAFSPQLHDSVQLLLLSSVDGETKKSGLDEPWLRPTTNRLQFQEK